MIVIPALHVRAGIAVVEPGDGEFTDDPTGCVMQLVEAGAQRIQVVNADANRGVDDPRSRRAVRAAVNALRDASIAVDVAAGVRSRSAAEFWIETGASSAVLGSIAVYRPDIAGEICRSFPGRIMLGLDVRGELAHSEGWVRDAGDATIHLRRWSPWPAAGVVRTNADHDRRLVGAALESLRRCIRAYPGPLLAHGDSYGLADLAQAAAAGAAAVIIDVVESPPRDQLTEAVSLFPGRDLVAPLA